MTIGARAVTIRGKGGPEVLSIADVTVGPPGRGEVLVRVHAAGLNRADVLQRKGFYPAPAGAPPDVPGLEYAGVVEALGPGCTRGVGDRVMGIVAGGGMCTHVVVHERETLDVPGDLDLVRAAALPEVFLTVFDALEVQAGLAPGDAVLVHAIGSGIGTAALQFARLRGATCIGTTRSSRKRDAARALGLEHAIVVEDGRFAEAVRAIHPRGADVVLDTIGAAYLEQNVEALAHRGRLVAIGLLGGAKGTLALGALLAKRATVVGSTLRARPLEEKIALAQRAGRELGPAFASGALAPVIDAVLPMADVAEAHRRLEADEPFGKLVLAW